MHIPQFPTTFSWTVGTFLFTLENVDTVLQLARHILQFQPNKDAARLCFYHFLIHHCEPTEKVNAKLMDKFNRFALQFEHWRQDKHHLVQEVQYCLQHFAEAYQLNIGFKDMVMSDRWQVVAIENPIDCLKVIEKSIASHASKSRLISAGNKKFLHLEIAEDQSLMVTQYNQLMIINHHGELEPLNNMMTVHYTNNLHLQFKQVQYVEVAPNVVARFMILGDGTHGQLLRGYTFQKADEFKGGKVSEHPQVFYAIKRMEQHYVDRKSDPMYVELTRILEKAIELLNMRHPEAQSFSQAALERGEQALENVFPDDNMVRLLTQTLRNSLQSHRNVQQQVTREIPWSNNANRLLVE